MVRQAHNALTLCGQKFGRLSVGPRGPNLIRPTGKPARRWVCLCECGNYTLTTSTALHTGRTTSCGCAKIGTSKRGAEHHAWRGGKYVDSIGYVLVYDPSHPNTRSNGYVREHTKIMSNHLGRPLLTGELVHHRNGQRADNRLENLELWIVGHPRGQRVTDQVSWAMDILKAYAPEKLKDG